MSGNTLQVFRSEAGRAVISDGDLPKFFLRSLGDSSVAIDIETSGLDFRNDEIGSIQVFSKIGKVCIIRPPFRKMPRFAALLADGEKRKIFHHAMFDLRFLKYRFDFRLNNIACTKIAAKIVYPDLERHSLVDLIAIYFSESIDKTMQRSNWLSRELSQDQIDYAIRDVIYLPRLLNLLLRDARVTSAYGLIRKSFEYIPSRVELDIRNVGDVFTY